MDKHGNRLDENNLPPPPPYSPVVSSSSVQESNTPYNPSCSTGDVAQPQPTAPSLYPDIPPPQPHTSPYNYQRLPSPANINNESSTNISPIMPMPTPQPHIQNNHTRYHYNNNNNPLVSPHIPPSSSSPIQGPGFYQPNQGSYQSIIIPPRQNQNQQQPYHFSPFHHHHHHHHQQSTGYYYEVNENQRRFPFGALLFVFGWFCPPLWILGACCCSSSRNPYEAWWARLNLIMALLLLFSSVLYSMLAIVTGDYYVGLQWAFAKNQES
ncbi:hypothetical protein BJ944DRAFT_265299 [Cunninghamella echinulata]|nr:hypothetical protein BJ944DRAFT_265299 [Cunninghamella echinulata]